jgi:hypothetical protein
LWLDLLRRAWGGPLGVNSGWRCAPHNSEVGGSRTSRHLIGCAADIRPILSAASDAYRAERFFAFAARFFRLPGWEFRLDPTFIHAAAPRDAAEASWDGGVITL